MKPRNHLLESYLENTESTGHPVQVQQTIVTRELSEDQTKRLVDVARRNNTTVHGILSATSHVVLCEILREKSPGISPPEAMGMIAAVNIRKECVPAPPGVYLGHYAVPMMTSLPYSENGASDIPKLARGNILNMKKQLDSGSYLLLHKVLDTIGGDAFMNITRSLSSPTQEINPQAVSNLGRHLLEQTENRFKVAKFFFTVSWVPNSNIPSTMFCNEVVTLNGKLYWVTGYDHTLVGRSQAEEYVSKIFEQIDSIC